MASVSGGIGSAVGHGSAVEHGIPSAVDRGVEFGVGSAAIIGCTAVASDPYVTGRVHRARIFACSAVNRNDGVGGGGIRIARAVVAG